jgi:hypothetical protein
MSRFHAINTESEPRLLPTSLGGEQGVPDDSADSTNVAEEISFSSRQALRHGQLDPHDALLGDSRAPG